MINKIRIVEIICRIFR